MNPRQKRKEERISRQNTSDVDDVESQSLKLELDKIKSDIRHLNEHVNHELSSLRSDIAQVSRESDIRWSTVEQRFRDLQRYQNGRYFTNLLIGLVVSLLVLLILFS